MAPSNAQRPAQRVALSKAQRVALSEAQGVSTSTATVDREPKIT